MQSQARLSYAEVQLILCKDNANRMQSQARLSNAEVQLILCKITILSVISVNHLLIKTKG